MRFAFLSAFPPYRGGLARFSAELVTELRRNSEVSAFTFTRQYPGLLFPGTSQYDTDAPDQVHAERVLDSIAPWTWGRTARAMAATAPDVAVLRYWMPFFGPSLGTVAKGLRHRGIKVISIVDNAIPHEPRFFDKPFTRYFLEHNDGFVAMSERVKEDLLALRPDARVALLPHPLYDHFGPPVPMADARRRLGIAEDRKVSLFFGFIRDYKGLDLLIDAMAELPPDHVLVIAGEPYGDMRKYHEAIARNGLKDRVVDHIRYIADAEVPVFFSAADAVVLPYRSATQSGITAIAYHFGVPVIATDVGGLKEAVEDGRTGIIVPHPDAVDIAQAIRRFHAEHLATACRARVAHLREELSWGRFADRLGTFAASL